MKISNIIDDIISESRQEYKSAVAIIQNGNKWLLGLSLSEDDRNKKWVHPGGGIKYNETPQEAAVREAFEETGVKCKAVGNPFSMPERPTVAFVHCKTTSKNQNLNPNSEFAVLGFFKINELKSIKLYKNVRKLIDKVR